MNKKEMENNMKREDINKNAEIEYGKIESEKVQEDKKQKVKRRDGIDEKDENVKENDNVKKLNANVKKANENVKKGASEFKKFIMRGNVVDLAVGVVMGGAFSNIVTSLVNNIIMPIIGILIGGIDFSKLSFKVFNAEVKYGLFIQQIVDFLIIAFCIFLFVKAINSLDNKFKKDKKEEEVKEEKEEVKLLKEIRDLLKETHPQE